MAPVAHVPTVIDLQRTVLDMVLGAGSRTGVTPVLHRYRDSPRLALRVPHQEQLARLVRACDPQLIVSDPATGSRISRRVLSRKSLSAVQLWRPVMMHGRMIHGAPSGIELIVKPEVDAPEIVAFPHETFASTWINDHLSGRELPVDRPLFNRLRQSRRPAKVDVVLTWVDDQDPKWQARRGKFAPQTATVDATDAARFHNQDELLYALRGLFRYFDGLGQVYLVTDGQVPAFWEAFADQVHLVDHADIMENDVARPTFNSHAIESCLHKIPGLADHYLYLNDDVILSNATGVCDFFDDAGRAKVFYSRTTFIPDGPVTDQMRAADAAAVNARDLLATTFDLTVHRKFKHCPIAIKREVICALEDQFAAAFHTVRKNRFRSVEDVAPTGSLYQHFALMTHQAVEAEISYRYLEVTDRRVPWVMLYLTSAPAAERPVVFCLNAVTGGIGSRWNRWVIRREMSRLFPAADDNDVGGFIRNGLFTTLFALVSGLFNLRRMFRS